MTRPGTPPGSNPPPGPPGRVAAALTPLAIGVALWAAVHLGDALLPPGPGEARIGRWLRKLAEHPLRGSLALGLLLAAGLPRYRSGERDGAPRGREGPPGPSSGPGRHPEGRVRAGKRLE